MCSFLVTSYLLFGLAAINQFMQHRGPDATTDIILGPFRIIHNLLSITGPISYQPFSIQGRNCNMVYNGEIYNYDSSLGSDGAVVLPLYLQHGLDFARMLDGEFSIVIVDQDLKKIIAVSDIFGTKPLFVGYVGDDLVLASYRSALDALNATSIENFPPNTIRQYSYENINGSIVIIEVEEFSPYYEFDLSQNVTTTSFYQEKLIQAIEKRSKNLQTPLYIGLSSGYDSGAIALGLQLLNVKFVSYVIHGIEIEEVVNLRKDYLTNSQTFIVGINPEVYSAVEKDLLEFMEPANYSWCPSLGSSPIHKDPGAVGLAVLSRLASWGGHRVTLSGVGGDELMTDYCMHGIPLSVCPVFNCTFPANLSDIAPFPLLSNNYGIKNYILAAEVVGGRFGIEVRYPFLDRDVVQAWLHLTPEMKMSIYKRPLRDFFVQHKFPFASDLKIGFNTQYASTEVNYASEYFGPPSSKVVNEDFYFCETSQPIFLSINMFSEVFIAFPKNYSFQDVNQSFMNIVPDQFVSLASKRDLGSIAKLFHSDWNRCQKSTVMESSSYPCQASYLLMLKRCSSFTSNAKDYYHDFKIDEICFMKFLLDVDDEEQKLCLLLRLGNLLPVFNQYSGPDFNGASLFSLIAIRFQLHMTERRNSYFAGASTTFVRDQLLSFCIRKEMERYLNHSSLTYCHQMHSYVLNRMQIANSTTSLCSPVYQVGIFDSMWYVNHKIINNFAGAFPTPFFLLRELLNQYIERRTSLQFSEMSLDHCILHQRIQQ